MRVCFGLSQTLVDVEESGLDFFLKFRPGAVDLLRILKAEGHMLILWTSKKRNSFNTIRRKAKELFEIFDEIYCKEDFELLEDIPGCSLHIFKNINKINADCLIESKQSYREYSKILGMSQQYFIVDKYREFLLADPAQWQIKMVPGIIETREKRRQEKENWVLAVFDFITQLKSAKIDA